MQSVVLLGSTGSIGRRTLEILAMQPPSRFRVAALAAGRNVRLLARQIRRFRPRMVAVARPEEARELAREFPDLECLSGAEGLREAVGLPDVDVVVSAISGTHSLEANLLALERGARLCLANKETLVAAGDLVRERLDHGQGELIPVDSEHSAVFQCLQGQPREALSRIILTASGGPFRGFSRAELSRVTVEMALRHPTWAMGPKITIDSATLMNKALELIEAIHLFRVPEERIDVLIHPQSIVHSMVEFQDGSILAQLGVTDMGIPIHYALNYPQRTALELKPLRLEEVGRLEFISPSGLPFPSISLARRVASSGGSAGAVFNAANEAAVDAFLAGKIRFPDIFRMVEEILSTEGFSPVRSLDDVTQAIDRTRSRCREWLATRTGS